MSDNMRIRMESNIKRESSINYQQKLDHIHDLKMNQVKMKLSINKENAVMDKITRDYDVIFKEGSGTGTQILNLKI